MYHVYFPKTTFGGGGVGYYVMADSPSNALSVLVDKGIILDYNNKHSLMAIGHEQWSSNIPANSHITQKTEAMRMLTLVLPLNDTITV